MSSKERITVWILVLLVATIAGAIIALDHYSYEAADTDTTAIETEYGVSIDRYGQGYTVASDHPTTDTIGLVYYPGALVDPAAYLQTLAPIAAEKDVQIIIPKMPLDLAIIDINRADRIQSNYPMIETWIVGGHSLGGATACRYVESSEADGLLLHGSYCDVDISEQSISVLSVLGTEDQIINQEAERTGRALLPPDATIVEIEGMTHAQFGSYGEQRGDGTATITNEDARDRLTETTHQWLAEQFH